MSHDKQFTLFSDKRGPNGWKVAFLLEELGLTYETKFLDFNAGEHKAPEFTKYNPNGRIPALVDHHNNDYTLWESGAILLYVVDKYDKEHKFSVGAERDKYHLIQWLFFQASGQGPYFGQAFWFQVLHPEKIPSAIDRYKNEIRRVFSVLEEVLSKQEWLVGGRYTVADISFVTSIMQDDASFNVEKDYPAVAKWHNAVYNRPAVKKLFDLRAELLAKK
ncbi:glutathione S-transferase [Panus rudis PR-1116 ss-1]|nr:glutathione S-transferase [Panus rudis PR-1116 ss-1]